MNDATAPTYRTPTRLVRLGLTLIMAGLGLAPLAEASTFRCNSRLVSLSATTQETLETCGEPASRSLLGYRSLSDGHGGWFEVPVEEWLYGPRNGMYHYLRFEGNRLRAIDSRRRP